MIDTDIATHIRNQIAELDAERQALANALAALDDRAPARAEVKPAVRRRTRPSNPTETSTAAGKVVPLGKILQLLTDTDGQTTSTLAKSTGGDQSRILELLKAAEADDKVKRSGQRRATRWHLITEESKVADRVAELEAGPNPEAAAKRRAARRKAAAERKVKAAADAVETPDTVPTAQ